jgi:hypothetical protein
MYLPATCTSRGIATEPSLKTARCRPIRAIAASASGRKQGHEQCVYATLDGSSLRGALPYRQPAPSHWTRRTPCHATAKTLHRYFHFQNVRHHRGSNGYPGDGYDCCNTNHPRLKTASTPGVSFHGLGNRPGVLHSNHGIYRSEGLQRHRAPDECLIYEALRKRQSVM